MSKYEFLWNYIANSKKEHITLSFNEIEKISGFSIDHSFLNFKKELLSYGYITGKISMKNKTISFSKAEE